MVLDKIKNMFSHDEVIVELQDKIKESMKKIEELTSAVKDQQVEQEKLLTQVKELSKDHKTLSKSMKESYEHIEIASEKISRVVGELLVFKPKLEKELAQKFQDTLQKQLDVVTTDLKVDVKEHKKAQDLIEKTHSEQEKLLKEITKLQEIVKGIDAKDFELSKHAKELHLKDQEKLRLMKRVDDLEKMLAKMKTTKRN